MSSDFVEDSKMERNQARLAKLPRYRDESYLKKLGKRLKKLRIAKGYSIDRIHLEGEGLNRSSLSRIERGLTDPQITTLKRICEVIDVPLNELLDFE